MKRKHRTLLIGLLFTVLVILVVLGTAVDSKPPIPVTVTFVGFTNASVASIRKPQDPWGRFRVQNISDREVTWAAEIEAPFDLGFERSSIFISNLPRGTLPPGGSREFEWPVPGAAGQSFRAVVHCDPERRPPSVAEFWQGLFWKIPYLGRFWPPNPRPAITVTGDWHVTPEAVVPPLENPFTFRL